ncbi:hypothetical protein ACFHW2_43140, partial [Actinomadura sp. LOL_016]
DQIAVTGILEPGAVASLHYRGGRARSTNFLWEINGTEGDLVVTGDSGHLQFGLVTIHGSRGKSNELAELPVPEHYDAHVPALVALRGTTAHSVAHAYVQLRGDLVDGTHTIPDFAHAARHHRLLEQIQNGAATGERQRVTSY